MHPDADLADASSIAWMRQFALCADETERGRLSRSGSGRLAARLVPHATTETLQIVSDFFIWNIALDDEYCDEGPLSHQPGELARTLSLILRAAEIPDVAFSSDDRYAMALRDIARRVEKHATPAQVFQWFAATRGWFLSEAWKAGNVAAARIPTLQEYATLRLHSGGGMVFPVLAAIADDYAVPLDTLEDRRVKALSEMATSLAAWLSDIVSYDKENEREPGGHNLINVIQHEHRCTPGQAVTQAVAMYRQITHLFIGLRDSLIPDASPELHRYLQSLEHYVRAAVDWCHTSERYGEPGSWDTPKVTAVATSASDPVLSASSIASIAWWWQTLGKERPTNDNDEMSGVRD